MKTIQTTGRFFFITAILLAALLSRADHGNAGDGFYEGLIHREQALQSAAMATREAYPDADMVEVDSHRMVRYQPDGTYEEWLESYFKVLTEKGRRELRTVRSYFTLPYNTTEFQLLEVIGPDGSVTPVDIGPNSREMVEPGQMDSNIYDPNSRILQVGIPQLNVGDTVHFIIYDRFDKVRVPDTFSDYMGFESTHPMLRSVYTVIGPVEMPLQRIALKNEISGVVTHVRREEGNRIRYSWTARNAPMAFMEPDMPPFYGLRQRVLVSTIPDWKWISRWYWNLCLPRLEETSPELERAVQDILSGAEDRTLKIRRLFDWVSRNVRYLGLTVETEAPGWEPHPVRMTFESRAGVCRDKAALLVAMLRIAGMDAFPVLIQKGPKIDPDIAQPFFNHAVVAVLESDGGYLLMDPTDENAKQLFPSYLNDLSYLVARPEGDVLRISPIDPIENNMMDIQTTGVADASGAIRVTSTLAFNGINDNVYRGHFARLSPDERRAFFERAIQHVAPGARLGEISIEPSDMGDASRRLSVKLNYEIPDVAIRAKDAILLPIPRIGGQIGMIHFILGRMGLDERRYPIRTDYACGVRETISVDIPWMKETFISLPRYGFVEHEGASWIADLDYADGRLTGNTIFQLKLPEYSPEQYLALRETLKQIETDMRRMPILPAPSAAEDAAWQGDLQPDAILLEEATTYDLTDERNWTETIHRRIRVLTYAGMKDNSDLTISYNPAWEDVQVERASVRTPSGETKEIQQHEINLMDAEWVGTAPRYPAGKTLAVSLPGVASGSEIDYVIRISVRDRPFFSMLEVFREETPILRKTVTLKTPQRMKPRIMVSEKGFGLDSTPDSSSERIIAYRTETVGEATVHTFEASRVKPYRKENHLPPSYMFNPSVFVTTGHWNTHARNLRQSLETAAMSQNKTAEMTAALVGGIGDAEDRIKAIRDFAAIHIRNAGPSLNDLPMDEITPADRTLSDGYGNSTDMAVLIHAMLQAAGVKSDFVIASTMPGLKGVRQTMQTFPHPEWFNRILVRIQTGEGDIYLNDTNQYAVPGTVASEGCAGLFLTSGQIGDITARREDLSDFEAVDFSIRLFNDGGAIVKKTRTVFGNAYASFRRSFEEMTPEKRRRHHLDQVVSISRSARPVGDYIVHYDSYPGIETFSVRVDEYAIRQRNHLYLSLPGLSRGIDGVYRETRREPLYRSIPSRRKTTVEVLLPPEMESVEAMPPEDMHLSVKSGGGEIILQSRYRHGDAGDMREGVSGRITVDERVQLAPFVVMPEDYPDLMETHRRLGHPDTRTVLIRMKDKSSR